MKLILILRSKWFLTGVFMTAIIGSVSAQTNVMDIEGSIKISESNDDKPAPGTIRFYNHNFEGWNGITWVALGNFKIADTVIDIDGNEYKTVRIGDQEWMAENLRVTRYHDGTLMQYYNGLDTLNQGSPGTRIYYNHDSGYSNTLGALYDIEAVVENKLCPTGWRMPNETDWSTLASHLGGVSVAGGKMKENGTTNWVAPNSEACNEYGFTAKGAGYYKIPPADQFEFMNKRTFWWSYTQFIPDFVIGSWDIFHDFDNLFNPLIISSKYARSVRCVKQ